MPVDRRTAQNTLNELVNISRRPGNITAMSLNTRVIRLKEALGDLLEDAPSEPSSPRGFPSFLRQQIGDRPETTALVERLRKEKTELEARILNLETAATTREAYIKTQKEESLKECDSLKEQHKSDILTLNKNYGDLEKEKDKKIGELEDSITEKNNTISSFKSSIEIKDERIKGFEQNEKEFLNVIAKKDGQIRVLELDSVSKDDKIEEFKASITEKDTKIKEFEDSIKGKDETITKITSEKEECDKKFKISENMNLAHKENVKRLEKIIQDEHSEKEELKIQNNTISDENVNLKTQLESVNKEKEELSTKLKQEQAKVGYLSSSEPREVEKIVYKDNPEHLETINKLNEQIEQLKNTNIQNDSIIAQKNTEIQQLKDRPQQVVYVDRKQETESTEKKEEVEAQVEEKIPEAPKEIIKEVEKIVEVPKEVIKEVEKIVEVPKEVIKEIEKIVEVPKEVVVEKEVERIVEKIVDNPALASRIVDLERKLKNISSGDELKEEKVGHSFPVSLTGHVFKEVVQPDTSRIEEEVLLNIVKKLLYILKNFKGGLND